MVQWHMRSKRKPSGGKRKSLRRTKKKLRWRGNEFTSTHLSTKEERYSEKGKGGKEKIRQKQAAFANVFDKKTGKSSKRKILNVIESQANLQYPRRNIITKGNIITIEFGEANAKAKVTSRPGQHGVVNAIFLEELPKTVAREKKKETAEKPKEKKEVAGKEQEVEKTKEKKEEKKPKQDKQKEKAEQERKVEKQEIKAIIKEKAMQEAGMQQAGTEEIEG